MSDFPEKENLTEETPLNNEEEFSTVFSDPTEHKKTKVKEKKKLLPKIIASVLAVAILAGGTVAVIKLIPEREEEINTPSIETIKLLDLKTDDFKSVTVTNKNGTFKLYSKEEEAETSSDSSDTSSDAPTVNWYLEGYSEDVISTIAAESIADLTASLEATREITEKTAAECGLDKPTVKADVVKNDGNEFSILVGNTSPDNTGTYVKLSTSDKIYITASTIGEGLTFDALSLASTDSVPPVTITDAIKSYTDENGALASFDSITISGTSYPEKVIITPNTDEKLSTYAAYITVAPTRRIAENVDGIFDLFKSGVSVSGAYSFETTAASKKKFGLDNPDLIAEMKLGNIKQTYSFKLQEDGSYAVWYDGAKLIKKISASSLSFIDYKVTDYYASWVILQSIDDLSNFTLKTQDKTYSFDIKKIEDEDADESYNITHNGKKLVAQNFQDFYQEFVSLSCSDYTIENVTSATEVTVVLTYNDTKRGATTVEFRKASETKYQYRIDGLDMGKVNSSALKKILRYVEKVSAGEAIN